MMFLEATPTAGASIMSMLITFLPMILIFYFLRNQAETTYALAYDSIRPKEQPGSGVVLGNIFQM